MTLVIAEVIRRRGRGEVVTDAQVVAAHPGLMPQLLEELEGLRLVQRAFAAGRKAGPIRSPLAPVPLAEIDAPIRATEAPRVDVGSARLAIPGYQIVREISTGGQATVYKAVQEATGKTVAIKLLPGGPLAGSRDRSRFDREAEILAALDHPNIVGIVDRGRTPDGSFYFVMQHVDGRPLDDHADLQRADGADGIARALTTFVKLVRAVAEAHARGIIHRDLKPSNILIDARGEPHLLDFGLATPFGDADDAWRVHSITVAGQVVGSLPWSSPEQVSGQKSDAEPRTDVYSLGVCLYQCVTGCHPYPLYGSIPEVIQRICTVAPPVVRNVPGLDAVAVQRVLERALAKSPGERYPTAAALADDLEALLGGRPVAPAPRRARSGLWRPVAGVTCVALLVAFASWRAWPQRWGRPPYTVFQLPSTQNTVGMTLVLIPRGGALIGTPDNAELRGDDERSHEVEISEPFWISTREVTRAEFARVMVGKPMANDDESRRPVTGVTWEQAAEFCRLLGESEGVTYQLPTEAQWEYVCRAGTGEAWSGTGLPEEMGWTARNSGGQAHEVALKRPNHWGVYDMHGNAGEWCLDWYNVVYPLTPTDPVYRDRTLVRVVRGGSFLRPEADSRSAARHKERPDTVRSDIGFRVVRKQPSTTGPATRDSLTPADLY